MQAEENTLFKPSALLNSNLKSAPNTSKVFSSGLLPAMQV